MTPFTLIRGDCREVMAEMEPCSVDAIVTDPPYDLTNTKYDLRLTGAGNPRERRPSGFMGKRWDGTGVAFDVETWAATLRVLKPGGHLLAFGAPRTYHRMAVAIEDAGFEIRDCLQWLFGSGFPKSLNLHDEWGGWGTALKPAYEPIVLARKPLTGTVAANVAQWGTGGLNIEGCRIETAEQWDGNDEPGNSLNGYGPSDEDGWTGAWTKRSGSHEKGRWPANVLLDKEAAALLDAMSGEITSKSGGIAGWQDSYVGGTYTPIERTGYDDRGGASRFFYTAKASRAEREFGLSDLEPMRRSDGREKDIENPRLRTNERRNDHPTVKPTDLMRWLCRLVTPPGGLVLDPFCGSGSTGMAALDEGFRFVGVDLEERYLEIARRRIARRHVLEPLPAEEPGVEQRRLL